MSCALRSMQSRPHSNSRTLFTCQFEGIRQVQTKYAHKISPVQHDDVTPQEHTPTQHRPLSRLSTLRRTIWAGPPHLNPYVARSPTHARLTKSYAHAPPTISTGSEAPMRRGVEGRSPTSSRPSDSRRASRTRRTALRLDQPIHGAHRARAAPHHVDRPPARAQPALGGAPTRGARSRASMSVTL
jgi:hypothetical protein